jgi:hypothetical protein
VPIDKSDIPSSPVPPPLQVSSAFEYGGTVDNPSRHKNWFRAIATESEPDRGLILHVGKRPRVKKGLDPAPTVRIMRPNPAGMLYAKIKAGDILVETHKEFTERMILMADAGEDIGIVEGVNDKDHQKGRKGDGGK